MPILLKKIDGSIISYFSSEDSNYLGKVILIKSILGDIGVEDYISFTNFEAFVQNFSSVVEAEFCVNSPITIGPINCITNTELNISY